MPSFHAHYNGHVIESTTAANLAAAKRYYNRRYGNGAVEVKGDPTEDEVAARKIKTAVKEAALQVGVRVRSAVYGEGVVLEREQTPKTGLFVTVRFDSGIVKSASSYYVEVV